MTTSNPIVGGTTLSTLSSSREVLPSPGIQVLIPQHVPGPFYYPPCKCDLVNQVSTLWHYAAKLSKRGIEEGRAFLWPLQIH